MEDHLIPKAALLSGILCLLLGGSLQARELASYGELVASTADAAWCGEAVSIEVTAPSADAFSGDKVSLQRLTGGVRALLGFECPQAKAIKITGIVEGKPVYTGMLAEASQWVLVDIAQPIQATDDDTVAAQPETLTAAESAPAKPNAAEVVSAKSVAEDAPAETDPTASTSPNLTHTDATSAVSDQAKATPSAAPKEESVQNQTQGASSPQNNLAESKAPNGQIPVETNMCAQEAPTNQLYLKAMQVVPEATGVSTGHGSFVEFDTDKCSPNCTHPGVDIVAADGAEVCAWAHGEIVDVVDENHPDWRGPHAGTGYAVKIRHSPSILGKQTFTVYMHLRERPQLGRCVLPNQRIGEVGQSGLATESKLHFEVRHLDTTCDGSTSLYSDWGGSQSECHVYGFHDHRESDFFRDSWSDPTSVIPRPLDQPFATAITVGGPEVGRIPIYSAIASKTPEGPSSYIGTESRPVSNPFMPLAPNEVLSLYQVFGSSPFLLETLRVRTKEGIDGYIFAGQGLPAKPLKEIAVTNDQGAIIAIHLKNAFYPRSIENNQRNVRLYRDFITKHPCSPYVPEALLAIIQHRIEGLHYNDISSQASFEEKVQWVNQIIDDLATLQAVSQNPIAREVSAKMIAYIGDQQAIIAGRSAKSQSKPVHAGYLNHLFSEIRSNSIELFPRSHALGREQPFYSDKELQYDDTLVHEQTKKGRWVYGTYLGAEMENTCPIWVYETEPVTATWSGTCLNGKAGGFGVLELHEQFGAESLVWQADVQPETGLKLIESKLTPHVDEHSVSYDVKCSPGNPNKKGDMHHAAVTVPGSYDLAQDPLAWHLLLKAAKRAKEICKMPPSSVSVMIYANSNDLKMRAQTEVVSAASAVFDMSLEHPAWRDYANAARDKYTEALKSSTEYLRMFKGK